MNWLRLILIVLGALVIAGIYFSDRWRRSRRDSTVARFEPSVPDPADVGPALPAAHDGGWDAPARDDVVIPVLYDEIFVEPKAGQPSAIININIFAPKGGRFSGEQLGAALDAVGLSYGAMRIYHFMADDGDRLFSLANSVEPGFFEPDNFAEFNTPGVSMFLVLPGPSRPGQALEAMIATAQHLGERLQGRLLDSDRNPLRGQGLEHLRERVREYERQSRVARARP